MGCDIHSYGECGEGDRWIHVSGPEPFDSFSYPHFAFLADVRNDWQAPPIAAPRGLPKDVSYGVETQFYYSGDRGWPRDDYPGWHSASWLTVAELTAFDYDRTFEDHAPMYEMDGRWYYEYKMIEAAHGGRIKTYREFLGVAFFNVLRTLTSTGIERVVFWFDN
jgi:hypothetical protein